MARTLDYYFTVVSPWAYIGHRAFVDVARRHDLRVRYHPVSLGTIFPESGGVPLAKRHPLRVRYREIELQRWREKRGLQFHIRPKHWPFDPTFPDCVIAVLASRSADVERVLPLAFAAVFEAQRDLTDRGVVAALLRDCGLDADEIIAAATSPETTAAYRADTEAALAAGVFGSPAYVLEGEVFWGQDRIELLDEALTSGRAPLVPLEAAI